MLIKRKQNQEKKLSEKCKTKIRLREANHVGYKVTNLKKAIEWTEEDECNGEEREQSSVIAGGNRLK